jgi:hypothetical protein
MYKSPMFRFLLSAVAALVFSTAAFGQATRTWVSGVGDDVNPCSRTAPCKTFAGAISKTAEGGEIDALDPAGYGTLTITKAITVDGGTGSGWASVLNTGGIAGFNVNITTGTHVSDAVVILRNITINGAIQAPSLGGTNGINVIKVNRLFVLDCHIEDESTTGIHINTATTASVFVRNTDFSNTNTGIDAGTSVGGQTAILQANNINIQGNTNGVLINANGFGFVNNSFLGRCIGGNATQAASGTTLNIDNCQLFSNSTAVNALAGSTIRVNNSQLFDNSNGFAGTAASIQSGGNNKLAGNTASITPTGPALTNQ